MTPGEFLRRRCEITDEKRAESRLRGLGRAASAITAAGSSLVGVLQVITDQAREIIGAHQSVTSVTIDQNWTRAVHAFSLSDNYARYRTYDARADGSGIYSVVCRENRTMRMTQAELEAHPAWRGFGKEAGKHPPMRGWLAAPLIAQDGTNLGLIQLSDKYAGEFTEEDEAILIQLAQLASRSIERHRAALVRWRRLSSSREREKERNVVEPEQIKAREYLYRKGTRLAPREIYERVRAAFEATEEFLDGVSAADARQRPGPGEWNVQEVVDHLVETHRPSLDELRCLLRGERPTGGPVPASLQSKAPLTRPWAELVGELKRLHAEILAMLAAVPEGFTSKARAPLVMVINAKNSDGSETSLQWIEDLDWKAYAVIFRLHEIDHLNQAKRALKAVKGHA